MAEKKRLPLYSVPVGEIYVSMGEKGKVWLIASEDFEGKYAGEGLEPDEEAMREFRSWLRGFFLKHIEAATGLCDQNNQPISEGDLVMVACCGKWVPGRVRKIDVRTKTLEVQGGGQECMNPFSDDVIVVNDPHPELARVADERSV